jgi:hypothetical protein
MLERSACGPHGRKGSKVTVTQTEVKASALPLALPKLRSAANRTIVPFRS